jgi:hypothetical protein
LTNKKKQTVEPITLKVRKRPEDDLKPCESDSKGKQSSISDNQQQKLDELDQKNVHYEQMKSKVFLGESVEFKEPVQEVKGEQKPVEGEAKWGRLKRTSPVYDPDFDRLNQTPSNAYSLFGGPQKWNNYPPG